MYYTRTKPDTPADIMADSMYNKTTPEGEVYVDIPPEGYRPDPYGWQGERHYHRTLPEIFGDSRAKAITNAVKFVRNWLHGEYKKGKKLKFMFNTIPIYKHLYPEKHIIFPENIMLVLDTIGYHLDEYTATIDENKKDNLPEYTRYNTLYWYFAWQHAPNFNMYYCDTIELNEYNFDNCGMTVL